MFSDGHKGSCQEQFVSKNYGICEIPEGARNSVVFGWMIKLFEKQLSFPVKCPYLPGVYSALNVPIKVPGGAFRMHVGYYCFNVKLFAKVYKSKQSEILLDFQSQVKIEF